MNQELIDLILGELEPDEARRLEARLQGDPALAREHAELKALFALMERGEELEPSAAVRERIMTEARRVRPPLGRRIAQIPGLVRYRFQHSRAFRVAAASLVVHLVVMGGLFVGLGSRAPDRGPDPIDVTFPDVLVARDGVQRPSDGLVLRLLHRRAPHGPRLRKYGVDGQQEAIRTGLDRLLARQRPDGSFGAPGETAWATLALLAEGDCSARPTRGGRAIHDAMGHLLEAEVDAASAGPVLAALVEDYALSFERLNELQRLAYTRRIDRLIPQVGDGPAAHEALALAALAGFDVEPDRLRGAAAVLVKGGDRDALLAGEATRFGATVVLARGQSLETDKVRAWTQGLFERARDAIEAGNVSGVVVLTLQAPYRL